MSDQCPIQFGTPEYIATMVEDFCRAVAMTRTATGDAEIALRLSTVIRPGMWLLGGGGSLDWEHHRVLKTTDTPKELLDKTRVLLRGHFKNLPVLTQRITLGHGYFDPEDPDLIRQATERVFRAISARIAKNARDGFDPKSNRGFDIF